MDISLIDASSIFTRLRAPGLIAIAIAGFLAFVSLARRTAHLILNRVRGISVISNQAALVFTGEWSDTDTEPDTDSDSDESAFSDEEPEIDMETHGDTSLGGTNRDGRGQDGNFDVWWGGSVVKTWEGLGLFGSGLSRSAIEDDAGTGTNEMPLVRYWGDDNSVRSKPRRRRSFVMRNLW